jgi:hypothetical protein
MTALYIFATVFGLGVVLVDFFMMMSSGGSSDDSGSHGSDGDGHGHDDGSSHDDASADDGSHHGDQHGHHHGHHPDGSVVGHQKHRGGFLLKTLGMFRHAIYFCVGFGPFGLFAKLVDNSSFAFLWALMGGIVVSVIAGLFRRIQKDKLDSSINESELLLEKATVLVSMAPGKMGKVRIAHGGMNIDRYAVAKNMMDEFKAGDEAVVSEIRDDYVIIEPTI